MVEVLTLIGVKRCLVFFVIELQTRRVQIAGIHPQPGGAWGGLLRFYHQEAA